MSSTIQQLKNGTELNCSAGRLKVKELIGTGGQGEVYSVELNSKKYALKYYYPESCSEAFKSNIKSLVDNPVDSKSFAWPLYFVENGTSFGYVMDFKSKELCSINEWIGGRVDTTLDVLVKACANLCDAFHELHALGYSYKDISNTNVSFNPKTGDVLIFDNDNVTPNLGSTLVLGTPSFMAPEIVSGKTNKPTRLTDLHSLAVLLFQILFAEHPLNGAKEYNMPMHQMDEKEIAKELYSYENAQFIFADPYDLNRYICMREPAHCNARDLWKMYPQFIRDLFLKAFVIGIRNPNERPQTVDWKNAFIQLYGMIYKCDSCGYPLIYDNDYFKICHFNREKPKCKRCNRALIVPRIGIPKRDNVTAILNDEEKKKKPKNVIAISNGTELVAGFFDEIKGYTWYDVLLKARLEGGRLSFINVAGVHLVVNGKIVGMNQNSDYITMATEIYIEGLPCKIAF